MESMKQELSEIQIILKEVYENSTPSVKIPMDVIKNLTFFKGAIDEKVSLFIPNPLTDQTIQRRR